jgi:hypothetical protein
VVASVILYLSVYILQVRSVDYDPNLQLFSDGCSGSQGSCWFNLYEYTNYMGFNGLLKLTGQPDSS